MRNETAFVKTDFAELDSEFDGHMIVTAVLINEGYRQVSNAYQSIARVDISEDALIMFLQKRLHWENDGPYHADPGEWQDHYRRCYSRDVICDVPEVIMRTMRQWIDYRYPCFK